MEKKDLICHTAVKVIARDGYYNTKVQTIADEANIAVGTIYHYFQSKDEILDCIFRNEFEKRIKYLEELEGNENLILNKIRMFLEWHLKEFMQDRDKMKVIAQEIILFSKYMSEPTKRLLVKMRASLGRLIKSGQQSGEIRNMDTYAAAIFIFHSLRFVVYTKQFQENNKEYEVLKNETIEFIINGLKK